jgi:hypothetical protein
VIRAGLEVLERGIGTDPGSWSGDDPAEGAPGAAS